MTDAELLANRSHPQPHSYLGAHPSDDRIVVRAFHPGAQEVTAVLDDGSRQPLEQTHPAGVFAAKITGRELPLPYRLDLTFDESGTFAIDDPLSSTVCCPGADAGSSRETRAITS